MDFEYTPEINVLAGALASAQGEMEPALKDSINNQFKGAPSKYANLASVWQSCRKVLAKYKLAVIQAPSTEGLNISITTMLVHESGQWVKSTLKLTSKIDTPHAIATAITYGRRYSLCSMVGIVAQEDIDDDGNASSGYKAQGQPDCSSQSENVPRGTNSEEPLFDPQNPHHFAAVKEMLKKMHDVPLSLHGAIMQALKGKTRSHFGEVVNQILAQQHS